MPSSVVAAEFVPSFSRSVIRDFVALHLVCSLFSPSILARKCVHFYNIIAVVHLTGMLYAVRQSIWINVAKIYHKKIALSMRQSSKCFEM